MSTHALVLKLPTPLVRLGLFIRRHETKVSHVYLSYLKRRNEKSLSSVVDPGGPVVSVTTYGSRLKSVHLVLESIAAGSRLPSRLILWVDRPADFSNPTPELQRLIARGLEYRLSDNYGPHTKYFPYLLSTESPSIPLVTADDDLLYSRWWLEGLLHSYDAAPEFLHCYRAHKVSMTSGRLAPYRSWQKCDSTLPSYRHFPTGVSGCIYPAALQQALKMADTAFLASCPKADDVWIHATALRRGIKIKQIRNHPLRFPFVPGTQGSGLYHSNVLGDQNDEQITRTYSEADLKILQAG